MSDLPIPVENDVLTGRDGELFLASGGHRVLDYALGRRPINPAVVAVFRRNIAARAALAKTLSAGYRHVIFPDKQSVITERFIIDNPVRLGADYLADSDISQHVFYPLELLQTAAAPVYLRTDTHLTDYASILVATKLAEMLTGNDYSAQQAQMEAHLTIKRMWRGDLGNKLTPQQECEAVFARTPWRQAWFDNEIPGGNNGGISIGVSPDAVLPQRLLWFGDSFGRSAIRFLSLFFREILFLRTPFLHPEIAEQMRPDFIVSGNAERYLASCTSDDVRPAFHMYPFLGRGTVNASAEFAKAYTGIVSYPRPPYIEFIIHAIEKARGHAG